MQRFDHYPQDWEESLPKVVRTAYENRDGRAVHQFARVARGRRESKENRQLAAVAHMLGFALDLILVQGERLKGLGSDRLSPPSTGARGNTPARKSGIRECKNPARDINR